MSGRQGLVLQLAGQGSVYGWGGAGPGPGRVLGAAIHPLTAAPEQLLNRPL